MVEEEDIDYFNEKQPVKVDRRSGLSRPHIKAGHTVLREESVAMDLNELNVLSKEEEEKLRVFHEYKESKQRKEEIKKMVPELAFDKMADEIANE